MWQTLQFNLYTIHDQEKKDHSEYSIKLNLYLAHKTHIKKSNNLGDTSIVQERQPHFQI